MIGYLYDMPPVQRSPVNAFINSGAMRACCRPTRTSPAAVVDGAAAPTVATPETGLNPSHPVHTGTHYRYAGWSDNGIIDQAELDAAAQFTSRCVDSPEPRD